ncbi:MAG: hypothetical protein K9H16_00930, partial [Bacteroidales bacterium]|nr:hypothetical protein [Bacteroidales bacterium]
SVKVKKPPKPVDLGTSSNKQINDYQSLHQYFIDNEKNKFKTYDNGYYLYSIYHNIKSIDDKKILFRLNYDNLLMLYTHNFSAGLNLSDNDPEKVKIYLSVGMGWGYNESPKFFKNPMNENAIINTQYFIQAEVEKRWGRMGGFAGIGFNAVYPERYDNNGTLEKNNGTMLDIFLGPRYYIPINVKNQNFNRNYNLYVHAKVGFPFTNGFTYENGNSSSAYYGLGFGITTLESSSDLGNRSKLMDIETGAFMAINSKVAYSQFVLPINFMGNLSLGLNGQIGVGYGESSNNEQKPVYYYGFGADFRFFAHDPSRLFNPYFGVMRNYYGYQIDNINYKGKISYLRIGDKIRLGKAVSQDSDGFANLLSNLFLDINISVPIDADNEWVNYTKTSYESNAIDAKSGGGYIQTVDSLAMDIPANFDFSIGLVYKFNRPANQRAGKYSAKWEVYNEEDLSDLKYALQNDSAFKIKEPFDGMLPLESNGEMLSEKRLYIKKKGCPPPPPPPTDVVPNIDASDIKMLTLTYESKTDVNRMSHNLFKTEYQPKDSVVLLLAMFDKERNDTKAIQNANMQLVFTDFNTGKLFGYEYDNNGRLKPCNTDIYREYVKELHWLDTDEVELQSHYISGDQIVDDVFRSFDNKANRDRTYPVNRENYRFAYAVYPKEAFDAIQNTTDQNFGISINFKYDYDKNFDGSDVLLGHFKKEGNEYVIDENDVSFFSNMVVGSELVQTKTTPHPDTDRPKKYDNCSHQINMGNFSLGSDRLSPEQEIKIFDAAKLSLNCNISLILGYTDKVEFMRNADFMNDFLAMENTAMNAVSPKLKEEWQSIADDWKDELKSNPKAIPGDELCQRGLSWRRIRTVMEEMNKYNLVDMKSIEIKAEGTFDDMGQGSNLPNNPQNRKVVIKFTNKTK